MKRDTYLYGARSGIQKAIRRGNLPLAKTCFEELWRDTEHRNWLVWRTQVLVEEDVRWMIGEYMELQRAQDVLSEDGKKQALLRLILRLCLVPKNRDSQSLMWLAENTEPEDGEHVELATLRRYVPLIQGNAEEGALRIYNDCQEARKLRIYERRALLEQRRRAGYSGGMPFDRRSNCAGMVLVWLRGLNQEDVYAEISRATADWCFQRGYGRIQNPMVFPIERQEMERVRLPWYAFDMHTRPGKRALRYVPRILGRQYPWLNSERLLRLWYALESSMYPREQIRLVKNNREERPSPIACVWWHRMRIEWALTIPGVSLRELLVAWRESIRPVLKDEVVRAVRNI